MTRSPFLDAVLKQQQLLYSPVLDAFRKQQETMQKLTQSPFADVLRRQQELMYSPVLDAFRKQQETMQKLTQSPFADVLRRQQELVESPVLDAFRKQQDTMRKLTESPVFTQLWEQQHQMAAVLSGPALDHLLRYQEELEDRIIQLAAQDLLADDVLDEDEVSTQLAWFNARSLQLLLWEMEGLLKVVEVLTAAGFATNEVSGVEVVDQTFLAVMVMLVLVAELVLWSAKGPPDDE